MSDIAVDYVAEKRKNTTYEKCPSCGAVLVFDPKSTSLKCDYCDTKEAIALDRMVRNLEYSEKTEQGFEDWGEVKNFTCSACGAPSLLPDYETSPICPFCNAANLIRTEEIKGLKPNGVLPFKLDKETASEKYKDFIKKKWLAPTKLRKNFKVTDMHGIYLPMFTFTTDTATSYEGKLGEYYYVTVGTGKNRRRERRIRYFNVSGHHNADFIDLQYEVSTHITQKDLQKLGGFDVQNALEYQNSFLAGFSSERYTEGLDATWKRAQSDMESNIRRDIVKKHNADVVAYLNTNISYRNKRYKYVLAPIWKCAYKFKEKLYNFFINARNGKTAGKAPVSPLKAAILALVAVGVLIGVLLLLRQ